MEELKLLQLASVLADAMVDKLKQDKSLMETLLDNADSLDNVMKTTTEIFGLKMMPTLYDYAQKELSEEMDEEDRAYLESFKEMYTKLFK